MVIFDKSKIVGTENFFVDKKQVITNSAIFMFDPTKFVTDEDVVAEIANQLSQHPSYLEVK